MFFEGEEFDDEDELEDLDEGLEDGGGGLDFFSFVEIMVVSKVVNVNDWDVERVVVCFEYVLLLGYVLWCI